MDLANSPKEFRKRLNEGLEPHGSVSQFCRVTGFARSMVDRWLVGESTPNLDNLDKIAEGLNTSAWELLRPESAKPSEHSLSECVQRVSEAALSAPFTGISPKRRALIDHFLAMDEAEVAVFTNSLSLSDSGSSGGGLDSDKKSGKP